MTANLATNASILDIHFPSTIEEYTPIAKLTRESSVSASRLRYYESRGLIKSVRKANGKRQYHRFMVWRINFISLAQRIGCTLEEIDVLFTRLPTDGHVTKQDWFRLVAYCEDHLMKKIDALQWLDAELGECFNCGCLSPRHCKLACLEIS